jgi:hypothetical protein
MDGRRYLTLDPERDPAAREALRAYIIACQDRALRDDLCEWLDGLPDA